MTHKWITGNCLKVIPELDEWINLVVADPPYDDIELINQSIDMCRSMCTGPSFFFMYPETIWKLDSEPDQILHWVKPPSTKNTTRKYSRFVEAIAVYDLSSSPFRQDTYWYTRSGTFTDSPISVLTHPHTKPDSLIEKVVAVNSNPGDTVLDPFAGSGTVRRACQRMNRRSISIERSVAFK